MAAIVRVGGDGLVKETYSLFDQYADVLNNYFSIQDTLGPSLGKLVLPWGPNTPASPANGQIWFDSDVVADGRLYTQRNSKTTPLIALRQRKEATLSTGTFFTSSTSYTDITNATVDITTTGGRLRAYLISDRSGIPADILVTTNGALNAQPQAQLKILRAATNIGEHYFWGGSAPTGQTGAGSLTVGAILSDGDAPPAGLYTIKAQGLVSSGTFILTVARCLLVVEEWDE